MLSSMLLTLFAIPGLYTLLKPGGPGAPPEAIELLPAPEAW
jgi:hypothetical protein